MLAFVTSLRHPQNSADYGRVEELLRETLESVTAQTSDDYVVIVVGNQRPTFELPEKVRFVSVDFPAPAAASGPHADRAQFVKDKGTKIGIGLIAAREHHPDFVMIFDADDFVHRELVTFTASRPESAGWVIDKGWAYSRLRNVYRRQDEFNRTCGTSFVIPFDVYGVPTDLDTTASQEEVAAAFGERLESILGAHRDAVAWHRQRGRILQPIPFRAAIYHVDTGENHSGKAMRGLARPIDRRLREDFNVRSRRNGIASAWDAFGPRAVWQSVGDFRVRLNRAVKSRVSS